MCAARVIALLAGCVFHVSGLRVETRQHVDVDRLVSGTDNTTQVVKTTRSNGSYQENHSSIQSKFSIGPWPQVFILGCQKCATSSLFNLLRHHPRLCVGKALPGEPAWYEKELHFFNRPQRFSKGVDFYLQHFGKDPHCFVHDSLYMDATPDYMEPQSLANIARVVPFSLHFKLKFIAILREQIARDLSWYNHQRADPTVLNNYKNYTNAAQNNFSQSTTAVAPDYKAYSNAQLYFESKGKATWLQYGIYEKNIAAFTNDFLRKQMLVLSFVPFIKNQPEHIRVMTDFLGLEPGPIAGQKMPRVNEKNHRHKLEVEDVDCETRAKLEQFFRPHNEKLYSMLAKARGEGKAPPQEPEFTPFVAPICRTASA